MKLKAVVCGGGGFIGSHLVKRLKEEGYWVRAVDIKEPEFSATAADEFIIGDLRTSDIAENAVIGMDEVYQLAADMGGMGFISGAHDSEIMHNSAMINLNIAEAARLSGVKKLFYSSSACIYPERNQLDPENPMCSEESAYPAAPDSEYGWEKIFGERLYQTYGRIHKIDTKIARFHNIYGPEGTWEGGREKAPAALSRKVAEAEDGTHIEVWGKGDQTRSFLYIDECLEGVRRLMNSDFNGPVNIGSEEMISINNLAKMVIDISGKNLSVVNVSGPEGVRGRNSANALIREKLQWVPSQPLHIGMEKTYQWVAQQVSARVEQSAVIA